MKPGSDCFYSQTSERLSSLRGLGDSRGRVTGTEQNGNFPPFPSVSLTRGGCYEGVPDKSADEDLACAGCARSRDCLPSGSNCGPCGSSRGGTGSRANGAERNLDSISRS